MGMNEEFNTTEIGKIPLGWEVKKLGEIGQFKNGINKSKEDFGFGFPFVNLMDVFGKYSLTGNEYFELINSNDAERESYSLTKGDVVFIRSSVKPSGVGLTAVVENDLHNTVFWMLPFSVVFFEIPRFFRPVFSFS
jgi:type I restriction enzyme S subunit